MMNKLKSLYRFLSPKFQTLHLEYKVDAKPRYGHGKPAHSLLNEIINNNRKLYEENLKSFLKYSDNLQAIKNISVETDENKPTWNYPNLEGVERHGGSFCLKIC
jgi:hypothetical protein